MASSAPPPGFDDGPSIDPVLEVRRVGVEWIQDSECLLCSLRPHLHQSLAHTLLSSLTQSHTFQVRSLIDKICRPKLSLDQVGRNYLKLLSSTVRMFCHIYPNRLFTLSQPLTNF